MIQRNRWGIAYGWLTVHVGRLRESCSCYGVYDAFLSGQPFTDAEKAVILASFWDFDTQVKQSILIGRVP